MTWPGWLQRLWRRKKAQPRHLATGAAGEDIARKHLQRLGFKFLTANYRSRRGEIDLVFRDADCLVFVEVKTRSRVDWVRPEMAVDAGKRRRLIATADDYVRALRGTLPKWRFDVVEVLLTDGEIREVRHLPNAFPARLGGSGIWSRPISR